MALDHHSDYFLKEMICQIELKKSIVLTKLQILSPMLVCKSDFQEYLGTQFFWVLLIAFAGDTSCIRL